VLRLNPQTFWSLSLKEWQAFAAPRRPALARRDLDTLMQRYPDTSHAR
jgi:uncharacterized phage protein (TIGR02216 family)